MPIDYDKIKNWPFPEVVQTYTEKDSILYALGVGYGHDPMDEAQLRFVYEKHLLAAPTMPVVLGYPGLWMKDPPAVPEGTPDASCDLPTLPQAALIYRLCADPNPLHAEPAVAKAAGFSRPILHGLCTYGVAGHAILRTFCNYEPEKLSGLSVRFSAPVYPGETIRTEMWRRGGTILFRSRAIERDVVVLNNGVATINA